jgi:serine/threonine protein phosphatase 1
MTKIEPQVDDQFVFLGDYVDRGTQTPDVLDWLIAFKQQYPGTIFLRGNHEQMLLDAISAAGAKDNNEGSLKWSGYPQRNGLPAPIYFFVSCGGSETLAAYRAIHQNYDLFDAFKAIPQGHLDFLQQTVFSYTHDRFMFVHASVDPEDVTGEKDNHHAFLWERAPLWKADSTWEKTVVHGHTPVDQPSFSQLEINLDTGAGYDGYLSACNVLTQEVWQAKAGNI